MHDQLVFFFFFFEELERLYSPQGGRKEDASECAADVPGVVPIFTARRRTCGGWPDSVGYSGITNGGIFAIIFLYQADIFAKYGETRISPCPAKLPKRGWTTGSSEGELGAVRFLIYSFH